MAQNKKQEFAAEEIALADFAKALSHPARIAIIKTLAERNTCICGEIVEVLPLAQSTVSQHLRELLDAGLIKGSIDGPRSCYCINWETFEKFGRSFGLFFDKAQSLELARKCC